MALITFITDAYRMGGIIAETATPSAEQGAKAVTRLNDMMASLAEDGIDVGYNPKTNTADTVEFPAGYVAGLKAMLAVILCSEIGFDVPATTAAIASDGYDKMLRQAVLAQNTPVKMRHISPGASNPYRFNILTG